MHGSSLYLNTYTVSFFGHRVIEDPLRIEQHLEKLIRKLLKEKEYVEFLVGRDGEFDLMVSSVIRRCQRTVRCDNSAHIWVLPYMTADYRSKEEDYWDYYDKIEICSISAETHFKGAYQTRNRIMVDRSNLVVFCIQHESGGAWQTMKYAKRQGKTCININNLVEGTE